MLKTWIRNNRGILLFLLLLGISRTVIADWNYIPSGSMRPNLLEGDVVFVNRIAYDLKLPLTNIIVARLDEPARGDVVVFHSPREEGTRLIKRVIGLPGDRIAMRNKALTINGVTVSYSASPIGKADPRHRLVLENTGEDEHVIQWQADGFAGGGFGPIVIPPDHFLMLGDNRDHSGDSRYFGLVRRELLIGRGERILVSADIQHSWLPRVGRFGRSLR